MSSLMYKYLCSASNSHKKIDLENDLGKIQQSANGGLELLILRYLHVTQQVKFISWGKKNPSPTTSCWTSIVLFYGDRAVYMKHFCPDKLQLISATFTTLLIPFCLFVSIWLEHIHSLVIHYLF